MNHKELNKTLRRANRELRADRDRLDAELSAAKAVAATTILELTKQVKELRERLTERDNRIITL
jgi:hypothetical protein